jgi:hypothetical protein
MATVLFEAVNLNGNIQAVVESDDDAATSISSPRLTHNSG